MKTYEEIKTELLDIANVLKQYPDNIQPQVFEILTRHFLGHSVPDSKPSSPVSQEVIKPKAKGATKSAGKSKDTLVLLKELDLRPSGKKSFKDFYEEKKPGPASEFNTIAVYYLTDTLGMTGVTQNHIYTCYKEVTKRPPEAFNQSLRDTASKNGYIDTSDINNIKLPLRGRNFVEHDLPKEKKKK